MSFEECLNDCLDRLQRGESLEACLARYPEHADALRELLQVGLALRAAPPELSSAGRIQGRERMRRAAEQPAKRRQMFWPRGLALPLAAAVAAVLLVIVAGAARTSVPGDLAYPLHRLAETAALRLTADPVDRAQRHLEQAERLIAVARERWETLGTVDGAMLTEMVDEIGEALAALAQATSDPGRARTVLTELAAVAYEARLWVSNVAPGAPLEARENLQTAAARLALDEQWAQAGLFDLALLQGYLRGETPPVVPALPPQPSTATPTPPETAATIAPVLIETQGLPSPTATDSPAPLETPGLPVASPTPAPTATSAAATPPAPPTPTALPIDTPTERPGEPTATPRPVTPTPAPTEKVTPTATARPATPSPTRPATPTPTSPGTPTNTPRPKTPTPTWTIEPTETSEPTNTPRPTDTPQPTDTPRPADTPTPTRTVEPTETAEPTETPRPTRTPTPSRTPQATNTPEPTETPRPTRTPTREAGDYPPPAAGGNGQLLSVICESWLFCQFLPIVL